MSKLSPALKELINAPFSRPGPAKAPIGIAKIYERIASEAQSKNLGPRPWIALSSAATFTLNSPDSLAALQATASNPAAKTYRPLDPVPSAELIREVGLKCISFNGIPRSINSLGAFRASLPKDVQAGLETRSSRTITPENLARRNETGLGLWRSVYDPFDGKLIARLAESHPDLPVHILGSHYAPLLSNPEGAERGGLATVGRVLTSLVAIACLRAQTGVGPQVLSHVFGLRKAVDQGIHAREAESEAEKEGIEWLASDEGGEWVLRSVDGIVEAIGNNFASKL
ncbi:conserved mitochondrial protein [Diaporthe amygdali]|uniref:conserved mitochondrial protein n=1 Tax=Phomopsis amygdali TaxID=1214568 RepID=UPI0022FE9AA2|nr:conserved mitochondrial protein [Diaporthe amygdali]KAJ0117410.1 conserved mitochondrial protein [Diaporthe amygdali]